MAQPSSSHRERDRERERSERSSRHHHHRTISSTTLLLVLSLVLAVLAVMLSLPAAQGITGGATGAPGDQAKEGLWGYLSPKRSQAIVSRESSVAAREADVARREAELLAGAPGGVLPNQSPIICPPCPTQEKITVTEAPAPAQTVIKEVIKEAELTPPGWWDQARIRAEDILDRELKIAEREREISRREEAVNRREHDASRRESWIMEQLVYVLCASHYLMDRGLFFSPPVPSTTTRKNQLLKPSSSTSPAPRGNPRYLRPSRAAPSSETKGDYPHADIFLSSDFNLTVYSPSLPVVIIPPTPPSSLGLGD